MSCGSPERPLSTGCVDRRLCAVEGPLDGPSHGVEEVLGCSLDRRDRLIGRRQGLLLQLAGQRADLGKLVVESLLCFLLLLEQRQLGVDLRYTQRRVQCRVQSHAVQMRRQLDSDLGGRCSTSATLGPHWAAAPQALFGPRAAQLPLPE